MPVYENQIVLELARGVKAFFGLRVGLARGEVPGTETQRGQDPKLRQAWNRVESQKQLIEKQRRQLRRARERLAEKNQRIAGLRERLPGEEKKSAPRGSVRWLDSVSYDGVLLPPKNLRPCGTNFRDDRYYLESAKTEADRLVEHVGLSQDSSLLDVGCGPGRLAIGIIQRVGEIEKYRGVDVSEEFVRWGQRHITAEHPNFQFVHIDVENRRYNPRGKGRDREFVFPFKDEEFDILTLYSVFTHMLTDGVRSYLKDFRRILKPEGRIFLTAFVEDGVPDVEENPEGYLGREWKGDLHCIRYNREFFEKLLEENGFRLDRLDSGRGKKEDHSLVKERGQSGLYISKKGS